MALAEVFPSGDGEVAAGAEAESPRIVELLKERRGGKSLPFGDSQLAAVAEEMVSRSTRNWQSPHFLLSRQHPSVENLYAFGCLCMTIGRRSRGTRVVG